MKVENLQVDAGDHSIPLRLYRPEGARAALVFLHGGGFNWGTLEDFDGICRVLSRHAAAAVVAVDYRLAPTHPWPAGFEDGFAALVWAAGGLGDLAQTGAPLFVAGDSAGACLAAGLAQRALAEGGPRLAGQLLVYPMLEYYDRTPAEFFTLADRFFPSFDGIKEAWDLYLTPQQAGESYALPGRTERLEGLPPALVLLAGNDPLRFEAAAYADRLREAGVVVDVDVFEGAAHGFLGEVDGAVAARAFARIGSWLDALVARTADAGREGPMEFRDVGGSKAAVLAAEGPLLRGEQDALDILGDLYGTETEIVVIPVSRVDPEFWQLRTGRLGGFIQKLVNYRQRVAFVGDLQAEVARSDALRDFVQESNRSAEVCFATELAELEARATASG